MTVPPEFFGPRSANHCGPLRRIVGTDVYKRQACTGAPMMMVDHVYYEHLTPETADQILDALK